MRIIIFSLLFLISFKSIATDFSGTLNGSVSLHFLFGTQLKAVNLGFAIFGTGTYNSASIEAGVNLNVTPFIQKFGVYRKNVAGSLEMFGLLGYGQNDDLLGSNIGLTRRTSFYDYTKTNASFYGVGGIVILNKITGDLSKFANAQGGLLIRLSHKQNSFTINVVNDASAKPFAKNGSDKGLTARVMVSYTTIRNEELYGFGMGLDMFTPEADYSRVPRSDTNSDDGMQAVSYNTKPFDQLFHLNLFLAFVYQSNDINLDGRIGMDNPRLGAYLQNKFHDSFGLYPRFSWPVDQKSKFYSLIDVNKPFNVPNE